MNTISRDEGKLPAAHRASVASPFMLSLGDITGGCRDQEVLSGLGESVLLRVLRGSLICGCGKAVEGSF